MSLGGSKRGKRRDYTDAFAHGFGFLYELPAMLGYGEHWRLSPQEQQLLGEKLNACIDSLPKGTSTWLAQLFEQYVDKYLPFVALGFAAYTVTASRVTLTQELMAAQARAQAQAKHQAEQTVYHTPTPTPPTPTPSRPPSPAETVVDPMHGVPSGVVSPIDIGSIFTQRQNGTGYESVTQETDDPIGPTVLDGGAV